MLHRNMLPVAPFELTILLFVFLSGAASLVYETIWFRQLSILFGNSTYAAATTLSVFFLGLAVGSYFFGRFTVKNPIKAYSIIELGIGFSALLYFLLLNLFVLLRPLISFGAAAPQNAVIFLISIVLLFPASFFIGGTLPIIGQVLVRSKDQLFKTTSIFYGVNTLGAVAGILLAGFILPVLLGFTKTYTLAIVVNFLIAGGAFALYKAHHSEPLERAQEKVSRTVNIKREYYLIIFLSGFITLGLEVLWTQMFAQEILNDVYSFSLVLFTIILALSIGSFASKKLDGARNPQRVIFYLLVSSSFFIGLTPFLFYRLADGLALSQIQNWAQYVFALAALSIATLLVPGIILGMIFPFTLKLIQSSNRSIGSSLGNWISLNLIGGITGSILAGFVFISFFGVLYGIFLLAVLYPVAALLLSDSRLRPAYRALAVGAPVLVALYFTTITDPLHLNPEKNEVLLEQYQSGYGTTSVIKSHSPHFPKNFDDLFIRLNNYYTLGGTGSIANEKRQAHLPLLLHPNPESVYILGMGTGLTAGAALDHPLQRLVVAEINPDVIQASQDYFREFNNGLFADPRVQVVSRDGRTYLHGTAETYDVIIGDLYNPTTRGISNLYTREHFQNVKDHLREDGLFAQWLPLYQLSEEDFSIITGTFLEVFPDATVWRGNFLADKPVLALVSGDNLSFDTMRQNIEALSQRVEDEELIDLLVSTKGLGILTINPSSKEQLSAILPDLIESIPYTFYAGQLSQEQYADTTINRDDFPIVEYLSPKNRSFEYAADSSFLTGHALNEFYNALATTQGNDSVLEDLTEQEREYVRAGNVYYKSVLFEFDAILANAAEPRIKSQEYLAEYLNSIGLD